MSILQAHLRLKFTQQTSKTGHPPASDTRCPLSASRQTLQKTPPPTVRGCASMLRRGHPSRSGGLLAPNADFCNHLTAGFDAHAARAQRQQHGADKQAHQQAPCARPQILPQRPTGQPQRHTPVRHAVFPG